VYQILNESLQQASINLPVASTQLYLWVRCTPNWVGGAAAWQSTPQIRI